MASIKTSPERPVLIQGETRNAAREFIGDLLSAEVLSGTPTVVEETTTDLTITNVAVNSAAIIYPSRTVAIGKAVEFTVVGQLAATREYSLLITSTTDASQTVKARAIFKAEA